ncbi:MAG TPA: universal stress protein [Pseudosphingobacterium sp.]|nr:universal stress protein [Pseudosphingobacterium sp.]
MKILVTTDLSTNSKAGIRFALQLALQYQCELTFFYGYHLKKPTWNDTTYNSFADSEHQKSLVALTDFVKVVAGDIDITDFQLNYYIQESLFLPHHIIEYALLHECSFICISRRGASWHRKLFGSVSKVLIQESAIPVMVIPPGYRRKKIKNVLYASDLSNFERELKMVVNFAHPLQLKIETLHFRLPSDITGNKKVLVEDAIQKIPAKSIRFYEENYDFSLSLMEHLLKMVKKINPSIMIMFTDQQRDLFERLFTASNAAALSSLAKWPMLVFRKEVLS